MESKELNAPANIEWQKKLLPFMIGIIIGLTLFFFVASFIQIYELHNRIEYAPKIDLNPALSMLDSTGPRLTEQDRLNYSRWKTLATLEGYVVQRRYHQANVLLMARIWTRYLGFVTGMILALVGAVFILGKLREPETKLDAEGIWKFSVTSASPGLILALLGTTLMITTIITHHEIEVKDIPTYTITWGFSSQPQKSGDAPAVLLQSPEEILSSMKSKYGLEKTDQQ